MKDPQDNLSQDVVDSHAPLDGSEYDADRDEVIARARDARHRRNSHVGTGDPTAARWRGPSELAEKHDDIYAGIGVHPHDARLFDERAGRQKLVS